MAKTARPNTSLLKSESNKRQTDFTPMQGCQSQVGRLRSHSKRPEIAVSLLNTASQPFLSKRRAKSSSKLFGLPPPSTAVKRYLSKSRNRLNPCLDDYLKPFDSFEQHVKQMKILDVVKGNVFCARNTLLNKNFRKDMLAFNVSSSIMSKKSYGSVCVPATCLKDQFDSPQKRDSVKPMQELLDNMIEVEE